MTPEQESQVLAMLSAFQNGKRLIDLPDAVGSNPFNLLVEVLENGESKKAALADMLPYLESECMYGVEWDKTSTSPACTRIGNMNLHRSLPLHNRMRGCLLDDDGKVVKYLDPLDWTHEVRDGSMGQVMTELPMTYFKFETDGNIRRVKFSEYPLPGYKRVRKLYGSSYEPTIDRTNNKLASVVNTTPQYRGGNNQADWDSLYKTELGRPATMKSLTQFRELARARKPNSYEWNANAYLFQKMLYYYFVVEYATRDTQAAYNAELDSNGFHQGGLGAGVTNATNWGDFDGYYPFVPCGITDKLGNRTGQVEFIDIDPDHNITEDVFVPRYRGIENPFGHIWKWTDGILVEIHPDSETGNAVSKVYVCEDPSKFSSTSVANYKYVGLEARENGYVKDIIFGDDGEIIPSEVGGGSTSYFCDYHYTNIPSSTTLRGVLFGGDASNGARAGLVCAYSSSAPSHADTVIGSRLCFIPAE